MNVEKIKAVKCVKAVKCTINHYKQKSTYQEHLRQYRGCSPILQPARQDKHHSVKDVVKRGNNHDTAKFGRKPQTKSELSSPMMAGNLYCQIQYSNPYLCLADISFKSEVNSN